MLLTHNVMPILLEGLELTAERGQRKLFKDISFSISAGEALHIIGTNGCGKTTLMRILAGLIRHGFQGRVSRNSPIFFMGHQLALKGHLTVVENLNLDISGWSAPSNELIIEALTQLDLECFMHSFVNTLSIGQQRKVSLARTFLTDHAVWLLDEPFTSLDKSSISKIEACISNHLLRGGALVITSHQDINLPNIDLKVVELGERE